jgi:hypothetical protein
MRFYTQQHQFYCGIDLHARSIYLCILNQDGELLEHRNMKAAPEPFLKAIAPYREDLVVCVECVFTWYWLADLCAREGIAWEATHARCPQGQRSAVWMERPDRHGHATVRIACRTPGWAACASQAECTRAARAPWALRL